MSEKAKSLYLGRLEEARINGRGAYLIFFIGASFILTYILLPDLLQITPNMFYNFSSITFPILIFGLLFCFLGSIEISYYQRQQLELVELLEMITFKDTASSKSDGKSAYSLGCSHMCESE